MATDFDDGDHAHGRFFPGHGGRALFLFLVVYGVAGGDGFFPGQLLVKTLLGHHIHAKRLDQFAKDVVGRYAVVLDVIQLRHHFLFHEVAHHFLDHLLLF